MNKKSVIFYVFLIFSCSVFSYDYIITPGFSLYSYLEFNQRTYNTVLKKEKLDIRKLSYTTENQMWNFVRTDFTSSEKDVRYVSPSNELKWSIDKGNIFISYLNNEKNDFFDSLIVYMKNFGFGFNFNGGKKSADSWARYGGYNVNQLLKHIGAGRTQFKSKDYVDKFFVIADYKFKISDKFDFLWSYNGDTNSFGIKYSVSDFVFETGRVESGDYSKLSKLANISQNRNYFRIIYFFN